MRIRTTLLAATIAALPALAFAQTDGTATAPSATPPAASSPAAAPDAAAPAKPHHDRAAWHKRRAEMHQKYQQLSSADKAKFDDLAKQIRSLRQQQMQLLGMSKS
ncbi:MAG TPA: hypothetical protein VFA50_04940 [Stellaceae bacterium]|nr:hypothetical protein [Stellaceae bacterium]